MQQLAKSSRHQLPTCCQPHWLVARRHRSIIAGLTVRNSCICSGDVFASVRAQSCSRPAQHSTAARVIVCAHVVTCSALHLSGLFYTTESLILKHLRKARVLLALCCCALDRVLEDGACVVTTVRRSQNTLFVSLSLGQGGQPCMSHGDSQPGLLSRDMCAEQV